MPSAGLQAISDHLPPGSVLALGPDQPEALASPNTLLTAELPDRAMRHPVRRGQYFMGRHLARQALAALNLPGDDLTTNADGSCLWPMAAVGSISHTRGLAAAWVAYANSFAGLGVDAECQRDLSSAAVEHVLTPAELGANGLSAVLRFSAKEAIYKCLAPQQIAPLRFQDVSVFADGTTLRFEPTTQCLWVSAMNDLRGIHYSTENHVLTMVWMPGGRIDDPG